MSRFMRSLRRLSPKSAPGVTISFERRLCRNGRPERPVCLLTPPSPPPLRLGGCPLVPASRSDAEDLSATAIVEEFEAASSYAQQQEQIHEGKRRFETPRRMAFAVVDERRGRGGKPSFSLTVSSPTGVQRVFLGKDLAREYSRADGGCVPGGSCEGSPEVVDLGTRTWLVRGFPLFRYVLSAEAHSVALPCECGGRGPDYRVRHPVVRRTESPAPRTRGLPRARKLEKRCLLPDLVAGPFG